jgi:ligand-binding sensor domain-containing protein
MTKYYLHKSIYSLLLALTFLTSCNGQTKTQSHADKKLEPKSISTGQPKIVKTQGSREGDNIHCSLQDKAGNLWFGTTGEGVYRYDGKLFTQFTKKDGLNSNCLYSILEDKEGNIWFGTENGVCLYNGQTITNMPFTMINSYNFYLNNSSNNNASIKNEVWGMLQDKSGKIWFGTTDGVYCYNGKTFSRFLDDINILNHQNLQLKWIQCFMEDSRGTIWMGSGPIAMEGVIRFDGKSLTSTKPNGDGWIRNMLKDKNENIWFGGRARGNFIYDGKNFKNFTEKAGIGNPILVDRAGNLWFNGEEKLSTVENDSGIWCYDGKTFKNYNLNDGISKYFVWNMLQDKNGNIWIGTRNIGLYKFDGKAFTNYSE